MRTGSGMSCRLAALADSKIFARGFFATSCLRKNFQAPLKATAPTIATVSVESSTSIETLWAKE